MDEKEIEQILPPDEKIYRARFVLELLKHYGRKMFGIGFILGLLFFIFLDIITVIIKGIVK